MSKSGRKMRSEGGKGKRGASGWQGRLQRGKPLYRRLKPHAEAGTANEGCSVFCRLDEIARCGGVGGARVRWGPIDWFTFKSMLLGRIVFVEHVISKWMSGFWNHGNKIHGRVRFWLSLYYFACLEALWNSLWGWVVYQSVSECDGQNVRRQA